MPRTRTRLRFELGGGWLGRLRPAKRVRPLQISEVAQAVEEHLRAAALVSLKSHYLPTRLTIRISDADWSSLRPFERHLRQTIAETYARLAEQPKLAVMMTAPAITFEPASHLSLGDPPVLESSFDDRADEASWWPGKGQARGQESSADFAYSEDGLFEVLITASPSDGTARQSVTWICLVPELPLELLAPGASAEDKLRLTEGDEIEGGEWPGGPPENLDFDVPPPVLEGRAENGPDPAPVLLFRRSQDPDVLWAPGGILIVGREVGN
ncbi:MAG: FhaA domain-containing protein, partial [Thermoanaerobaculia bacterium]